MAKPWFDNRLDAGEPYASVINAARDAVTMSYNDFLVEIDNNTSLDDIAEAASDLKEAASDYEALVYKKMNN